jgi:hypothetical protein
VSSTSVALHATHPCSSFFCCIRAMFISSKNLFSRYQKNSSFQFKQKLLHNTHLTKNCKIREQGEKEFQELARKLKSPPITLMLPTYHQPTYYLPSNLHITYLLITNLLFT